MSERTLGNGNGQDFNPFDSGTLIVTKTSIWTAQKKLKASEIDIGDTSEEMINMRKCLVDPDTLEPLTKIRSRVVALIEDESLPFPVRGVHFIPKRLLGRTVEKLRQYRDEFNTLVNDFIENYAKAIETARGMLGSLFHESDYPTVEAIRSKFEFSWQMFSFGEPSDEILVDEDVIAEERANYRNMMSEFRDEAQLALRKRFGDMVVRLADMLHDDGKRFMTGNLENIREFFDRFNDLNITNDRDLAAMVEKAKQALEGNIDDSLKSKGYVRDRVYNTMDALEKELSGMMTDAPVRLINRRNRGKKQAA